MLLFFGYGFGLMGQFPFYSIPLVAGLFLLVQWRLSHLWLHRRPQGPLEAIWKRLSYGRVSSH
ncbi:DUF418 domain-containing protein [Woeseia oceani]|uniref:DUF418 domain-containing protein n=1 Tax=Woeseia oceani TaxID=1548547 RepID=UPI0009F26164